MYYNIFYDDRCSTVPQLWLNFENQTFVWPPKETNVIKAIIKNIPPKYNWSTHTYRRITGPYETYEIARNICFSSLKEEQQKEFNQPAENLKERIVKRSLFYDELCDSSDNEHATKRANRTPSPSSVYVPAYANEQCRQYVNNGELDKHLPKGINDVASSTYIPASSDVNHILKDRDEYITDNINNVTWCPLTCKKEKFGGVQSECTLQNDVNDINNMKDVNDIDDANDGETQHDRRHTCCEACRYETHTMQETIIRKLDCIINLIENKDVTCTTNIECDTKLLPDFPLVTIQDFFKFEEILRTDEEIRKQFRYKIAKIGGKQYAKKTRNIMKFIINDSVAKKLSWMGRKEKSIAIKNTVFASIIINYITSTEDCSLHEVQKVIQEWLRRTGYRLNYLFKKIGNSTLEKQSVEWQQRYDKNMEIQESQNSILHPLRNDQA
ncbi:uncharacterized protein [Temnothorax nylanderi]|uniref:uncharacterized protein isoform X2 n=1 Tax=Temnothorax nylanderi TaxID=102681 RepID=UPI003A848A49